MTMEADPIRILFVFAWLVIGGEETEVRLLAEHLDRRRYRIDVVACFRKPEMPEQTHEQLRALGVDVDTTPYDLSFEDTVNYLARKVPGYDLIVACQNVADIYPALEPRAAGLRGNGSGCTPKRNAPASPARSYPAEWLPREGWTHLVNKRLTSLRGADVTGSGNPLAGSQWLIMT